MYKQVERREESQPRDLEEGLKEEDHTSSEPGRDGRMLPVSCEIDSGKAMPVAGGPCRVPCVSPDRGQEPFREMNLTDDNHDMRDSMGPVIYHSRPMEPVSTQEGTGEAAAVGSIDRIVDNSASIGEDAPEMRAANREDWSTMEDEGIPLEPCPYSVRDQSREQPLDEGAREDDWTEEQEAYPVSSNPEYDWRRRRRVEPPSRTSE
ncbi:hypothetical protein GE061_015174 [Apolygus lucorum]|uniref:Uncharacterized protein n=1 Tax=Apolygus lucorum TaxID=248454 RepID=A0A8S9XKB8_APOLU|nr:hypothetical protein GE061_015174 [Apolygus lucorum]